MTTVPLVPPVEFPGDPGLSGASRLFDGEWVWQAYCDEFGRPEIDAHQIRVRHFSHSPGRGAMVSYALEWQPDAYLPPELITVRILRAKPAEMFRYPEDSQLPGLKDAARPDTALRLVNKHVFVIPVRRVSVDVVRYRPGQSRCSTPRRRQGDVLRSGTASGQGGPATRGRGPGSKFRICGAQTCRRLERGGSAVVFADPRQESKAVYPSWEAARPGAPSRWIGKSVEYALRH